MLGSVSEDVALNLIYMDCRLNYILWIQDIVHAHDYVLKNAHRHIQGIDMYVFSVVAFSPSRTDVRVYRGTGSTVIYPFLGCKLEPEWEFVATGMIYYLLILHHFERKTELDDISYEYASKNVNTNKMESRIHLEKATLEGSIFFTLERNLESKFVNQWFMSMPYSSTSSFSALSSRCAIRLFTAVARR